MADSDDAREYQHCAQECVEIANSISNSVHRLALFEMAQAWIKLAQTASKKVRHRGASPEALPAESPRPEC
jgi:hypothetical protein